MTFKHDYRDSWPTNYRTQCDAGLPEGEIGDAPDDRRRARFDLFAWGVALGVLIGLALIDIVQTLGGF